jgi:hypothetical protein
VDVPAGSVAEIDVTEETVGDEFESESEAGVDDSLAGAAVTADGDDQINDENNDTKEEEA